MINIALLDDHTLLLQGLASLLETEPDLAIVGTATNGPDFLELCKAKPVDVAVIDYEMQDMNGLEVTRFLRSHHAAIRILVLSMYQSATLVHSLYEEGISGYMMKDRDTEDLVEAIRKIADGGTSFDSSVAELLLAAKAATTTNSQGIAIKLTKRERQVLELVCAGKTALEIADQLYIAASTVETHRRNLFEKLEVRNSVELTRKAIEKRLV